MKEFLCVGVTWGRQEKEQMSAQYFYTLRIVFFFFGGGGATELKRGKQKLGHYDVGIGCLYIKYWFKTIFPSL